MNVVKYACYTTSVPAGSFPPATFLVTLFKRPAHVFGRSNNISARPKPVRCTAQINLRTRIAIPRFCFFNTYLNVCTAPSTYPFR